MIELERHIEILLLNNDCVIVPHLGGFMTHHIEARYEEEQIFLPPQRTLGFNPQLQINDSLLAQSYIEAYDISYPEAVSRIEAEVAELKQHLANEGQYEMNDIGTLTVNEEGKLEFEPCEAGILTPELYGLSSIEMPPLFSVSTSTLQSVVEETTTTAGESVPQDFIRHDQENEIPEGDIIEQEESKERTITIKMSWIRNTIATAAAILAFLLMTTPVGNSEMNTIEKSQISLPIISKDNSTDDKLNKQTLKAVLQQKDSLRKDNLQERKQQNEAHQTETEQHIHFCIVMASQVTEANAQAFAAQLKREGFDDARVYKPHSIRRVICGDFTTEAKAYEYLRKVRLNSNYNDAWVYAFRH